MGERVRRRCRNEFFRLYWRTKRATKLRGMRSPCIFNLHDELVAFGEHIPWHNAFGESIGRCLPEEHPPLGCGVTLSGRVSFELVAEWARSGIELISAAPAPFYPAIEAALHSGITLCAFVRRGV